MQDRDITTYVYVENDSSGVTTHEIRIPIIARAKPTELYTPEQIDNYGSAMLELTDAIGQVEAIKGDIEGITDRANEAIETAEGWASASATVTMLEAGSDPTVSLTEDESGNKVLAFGIPAGQTGSTGGIGPSGNDGKDGFSPTVVVEEIEGGHKVVITDVNGEQSFDVMDGEDGAGGGIADGVAWENVTGKPDTFTPAEHTHTAEEIGAAEAGHTHTAEDVGARSDDWLPTADEIGAALSEHEHTAEEVGAVWVERNGTEEPGLPAPNDADTLGGIPAEDYALKADIPDASSSLPSGGTPGQILSVVSDDGDVAWVDANTDTTVDWSEIQNVPTEFTPAEHTHDVSWDAVQNKPTQFSPTTHEHTSGEISGVSIEEWTFTLEDGSIVTKKVLTSV